MTEKTRMIVSLFRRVAPMVSSQWRVRRWHQLRRRRRLGFVPTIATIAGALSLLMTIGCSGPPKDADREAAAWVQSTGGSVSVDVNGQSQTLDARSQLPSQPFKVQAIAWDIYPGDRNSHVTDTDLERLMHLTDLRQLDLWAADVTDVGVRKLGELVSLERLQLSGTRITDASLESLDKLTNLRELGLIGVELSPTALKRFRQRHPRCDVIRSKAVTR